MTGKPSRRRDPDAARKALLEAGAALFASRGFQGATLDAIAERSGLNKAMVSYYFGGKTGLYDAVLAEAVAHVVSRLETVSASLPTRERLDAHIDALADGFAAQPHLPAMLVLEHVSGARRMARERTALKVARFFQQTRTVLEAGREDGAFRAEDPHQVHLLIVGALIYFQLSAPFREAFDPAEAGASNPDRKAFADTLKRVLRSGLAAR